MSVCVCCGWMDGWLDSLNRYFWILSFCLFVLRGGGGGAGDDGQMMIIDDDYQPTDQQQTKKSFYFEHTHTYTQLIVDDHHR